MSTKTVCDRCGKTITVAEPRYSLDLGYSSLFLSRTDILYADLCPDCAGELKEWLRRMEVRHDGR